MRLLLAIVLICSVVVAAGARETTKNVTITLTDAQARALTDAKGRDVKVKLTDSQIQTIIKSCALDGKGTDIDKMWGGRSLNTAYLRSGNKVVISITYEGKELVSINPIPSP
jgi:hypothetical protein